MPSRNTIRTDIDESYYHVYATGASRQPIFVNAADYQYFLDLIARYLSLQPQKSKEGIAYPHFRGAVELLAYCQMQNHFHLLVYQHEQGSLSAFMKSLMVSYSRYFNLKYKRSGSLFENRFKASLITNDMYLMHISRYIHLNPRRWRLYPYSSIGVYRAKPCPEWLEPARVQRLFTNTAAYYQFLEDHEDFREHMSFVKSELANI